MNAVPSIHRVFIYSDTSITMFTEFLLAKQRSHFRPIIVTERLGNFCNSNRDFQKDCRQVCPASSIFVGKETAKRLVSMLQEKTVDKN